MKHSPIHDRIAAALKERRDRQLFRRTASFDPSCTIDLSTNSYLALQDNPEIIAAARKLTNEIAAGNLASRLIAERSPHYERLEAEIAAWKQTESALVFNSGYAANVGILQAVCARDTAVFSDRFNHASIIDGIRLSGAKISRYRHCDMTDLQARLAASSAREKLIVTDTVFSMDGDCAPLIDICECARRYGCMVMVDEAHATGIFGATASGLAEACGVAGEIDIRMGTLSKAIAGLGGFFAGDRIMRDHLVNNARSMIYSTGLPPSVLAWNSAAVDYIRSHPEMGSQLLLIAAKFRDSLNEIGMDTLSSTTQIVPCVVGDEAGAISLSRHLAEAGIKAPAIRPPTVPAGTARVRFSAHRGVTDGILESVIGRIREWGGLSVTAQDQGDCA
jgi:8-amino-7-oxononanoate synthase